MDCNELLAQLMEAERPADTASPPTTPIPIETVSSRDINHRPKRARLAAFAAGGQAKLAFKGVQGIPCKYLTCQCNDIYRG